MLLLLWVISIGLTVYLFNAIDKEEKDDYYSTREKENAQEFIVIAGFFVTVIIVVFFTFNLTQLVSGRALDGKINMYQDENAKIESQIDALVLRYMEYESETFGKVYENDSMILLSLFPPEIKSDALVSAQIDTYNKNSSEIKKLKEKKINLTTNKWWIYFGR